MYTVIVIKAMSSELTIMYKMEDGENRDDCLEFRNIVSEANFIVRKSVRYIRRSSESGCLVTQVLGLLIFTQPCDLGQTASLWVLFSSCHLSCLDFEPESKESEK